MNEIRIKITGPGSTFGRKIIIETESLPWGG